MKKVYIFYLYGPHDEITIEKYPAIDESKITKTKEFSNIFYAWTPNKDIRKTFKKQRDMNKFHEEVRELDKEDFNKFSDDYSDNFLEERAITSKHIDSDHMFRCKTVYILSTKKELDLIIDDEYTFIRNQLENMIDSTFYIREDIFRGKYKAMLEFFQLDDVMGYAYPLEESGLPFNILKQDCLAMYSHLYLNTYRKDW